MTRPKDLKLEELKSDLPSKGKRVSYEWVKDLYGVSSFVAARVIKEAVEEGLLKPTVNNEDVRVKEWIVI